MDGMYYETNYSPVEQSYGGFQPDTPDNGKGKATLFVVCVVYVIFLIVSRIIPPIDFESMFSITLNNSALSFGDTMLIKVLFYGLGDMLLYFPYILEGMVKGYIEPMHGVLLSLSVFSLFFLQKVIFERHTEGMTLNTVESAVLGFCTDNIWGYVMNILVMRNSGFILDKFRTFGDGFIALLALLLFFITILTMGYLFYVMGYLFGVLFMNELFIKIELYLAGVPFISHILIIAATIASVYVIESILGRYSQFISKVSLLSVIRTFFQFVRS